MTRINVVPVEELTDKHLGAEYRELPRIYGLVKAAIQRGESPDDKRNPTQYVLGGGHCRFFYPRLGFITERFEQLKAECRARGRAVNYADSSALTEGIPPEWFGSYEPTEEACALNRRRIQLRLGLLVEE